ncbi:hypothetical protein N658DRAFT_513887 [Parathielavia hyrcaniae]|uniref:Uncharacterized protein n=1 Tax=Parathielavia hyrcaniae TaxID=113614 RepID=A0AAN6Q6I3_9PEZI|nr:hypothetical protein N658DRAFT_513887 [Parathielavia hyrcaniae]
MTLNLELFAASLARSLNSAQIPCVLWGHCLLNVNGVSSIVASVDFVVPDDCLETGAGAGAVAQHNDLRPCPDTESCSASSKRRTTPPPTFHLHLDSDPKFTVGLYLQQETLWLLPPLDHALLSPSKLSLPSQFALASDQTIFPPWRPGRGSGVYKAGTDCVIALRPHVLLEAYMRLFARDGGKIVGSFGISMIAYMSLYVDKDGLLDASLLPEPLKTSYRDFQSGKKSARQWMFELKEALNLARDSPDNDDTFAAQS